MTKEKQIKIEEALTGFAISIILGSVILSGVLLLNTYHGDSTIYLVYARNIANGDLFSFNSGEFSSGSTSPLWAFILSIGFLAGNGILFAKLISLVSTLIALVISYRTLQIISKSPLASIIGTALICRFLTLPSLLMYKSSLIVSLIFLLVLNSYYIFIDNGLTKRLLLTGVIWSLIPVSRPDASAIVLLHFVIMTYHFYIKRQTHLIRSILLIFLISLVPTLIYYGYSFFDLGVYSVSAVSRAFSLQERAPSFLGFHYSTAMLKLLLASPMIMYLYLAMRGLSEMVYRQKTSLFVWFSVFPLAVYFILLSLISPVTADIERYILPVLPFVALLASIGAREVWNLEYSRKQYFITLFLLIFLVFTQLVSIVKSALSESQRGLSFDVITEKEIVEFINDIAEMNATILVYEVQDRFYLRPDISLLSLDGITDGKVAPYQRNKDIYSFLLQYKPDYWLANDAVNYRPYLSESILNRVLNETEERGNDTVKIGEITFKRIQARKEPLIPGFAAFRQLYKIDYEQ